VQTSADSVRKSCRNILCSLDKCSVSRETLLPKSLDWYKNGWHHCLEHFRLSSLWRWSDDTRHHHCLQCIGDDNAQFFTSFATSAGGNIYNLLQLLGFVVRFFCQKCLLEIYCNILFLRIKAVSSMCTVVGSAGGTLVEEDIDVATFEQLLAHIKPSDGSSAAT
jgi:hypothetical protein